MIGKIVLSRLPVDYVRWQRIGLFRHGRMDKVEYAVKIFHAHIARSGLDGKLKGKTVLELGPGDSVASAIIAYSHGAQTILVDAGSFAKNNPETYQTLARYLAVLGYVPPELSGCKSLDDVLSACNARYLTAGLESLATIPGNSVNLIFSQAVLEHVFKEDFLATQRECFRILCSDGVCSHKVDLRDHLGGGLNNLRFPDKIWESTFFVRSGFYTNRIRFKQMMQYFCDAGFQVEVGDIRRWDHLPIDRGNLAREFQNFTDEELSISGFNVVLRVPEDMTAQEESVF